MYCNSFFNNVINMLWEIFWGALHVCRSKIGDVENSFHICHIFESPKPWDYCWRGYATYEADQELKWTLRTLNCLENSSFGISRAAELGITAGFKVTYSIGRLWSEISHRKLKIFISNSMIMLIPEPVAVISTLPWLSM